MITSGSFDTYDSVDAEADQDDKKADELLDYAIDYKLKGTYPSYRHVSKDRKRTIRKRAQNLIEDKGEIFILRRSKCVKIVTSIEEQNRILQACHSDATSGHFGVAKTYKWLTERFYWRGITHQVRELVSGMHHIIVTGSA